MKNKNYLKHTWAHPALYVKKSSIDKKGVFTAKPIRKGEKVMIFGGILINKNDLDENKFRMLSLFPIDDDYFLGLASDDNFDGVDEYLNHSCDGNIWLTDEVTVTARRDIKAGEEITLDCATWDTDPAWTYSDDGKCYCGSIKCRKMISPDDWMKKDLQEKYKGHFAPYIQKKIDKLKNRK